MIESVNFKDTCNASAIKNVCLHEDIDFHTKWIWQHIRNGRIIDEWEHGNRVVDEGKDHLFNIVFGPTSKHSWYIAPINTDSHTPVDGDTYATVMGSGNYEFISYKETTRPAWVGGTATSKAISNSANKALYTIASGGPYSVYGAALVSLNTKDNSAAGNYMYSFGLFSTAKTGLVEDDVLLVGLTLSAT